MADTIETYKDFHNCNNNDLEDTSEEKNFKKVQNICDEIPDGFYTWTAQEQRDWLHQNLIPLLPNVPESLQDLIPGLFRRIDADHPLNKLPEWMDIDKYRRGQRFVRNYYFSVVVTKLFGLIYSYTFDPGHKIVILAGNSHTPYLSFIRHLTTIRRILQWYDGDPWIKGTKAYRDMLIARGKHVAINRKIAPLSNDQIDAAATFKDPWCPENEMLLKDFAMTCPFEKLGQRPYKTLEIPRGPIGINNSYVAILQGSFLILPLFYSKSIGIHGATDEDLEAFCHMWRCYGYFLGVKDEYNFCRGSFEEVKQRVQDLNQYWITVNFREIPAEWVHLTKCVIESINYYRLLYAPDKAMILLFTEALNLKMPNLYASLSYTEWIAYKFYDILFRYGMKFSIVRVIANRIMYKILEASANFGPDKLAELHKKSKQQLPDFSIDL